MNNTESIKDFYGRVIATIITAPNGERTIKDFYGRVRGTYYPRENWTKDFCGRVIGGGDQLMRLLDSPF